MDEEAVVQLLNDWADYVDEQIVGPRTQEITSALKEINPHEPKRTWEMLGEYLRDAQF